MPNKEDKKQAMISALKKDKQPKKAVKDNKFEVVIKLLLDKSHDEKAAEKIEGQEPQYVKTQESAWVG